MGDVYLTAHYDMIRQENKSLLEAFLYDIAREKGIHIIYLSVAPAHVHIIEELPFWMSQSKAMHSSRAAHRTDFSGQMRNSGFVTQEGISGALQNSCALSAMLTCPLLYFLEY